MKKNNYNFRYNHKIAIFSLSTAFFLYLLYLSIPSLYDTGRVQKVFNKKFLTDFNLNISLSTDISYRILPQPHFLIKDAKLFYDKLTVPHEISQIKELKIGSQPSYAPIEILDKNVRVAVVPFGFRNGYPRLPSGGRVLISGISAPVLGSRGTEHTVVDITNVTNAKVGSEVVILGKQEKSNISANEISEHTGVPLIELIPRLASGSFRNYIN